ncbi:MAG TPA: glycosyltransferase family 4 protein [Opitutaceae bacterium]|nr:glycosyltransferase family 4 protein [Opitutaceae bacterium]
MRVTHLLRKYDRSEWGGTETAIQRLTSGLAAQGVESVVYAPRLTRAPSDQDEVRRFRASVPVWGISEEKRRQLVALGGNMISFELFGSLWRDPDLDVIHSHALGRLGGIGCTVARRRRMPFVLSVHGGVYDLPPAIHRELAEPAAGGWDWGKPLGLLLRTRHLFAEADAIITCNSREADLIRERHPGRRVQVQPHGVPAALFAADRRVAARDAFPAIRDRLVLLAPGRIDPTKNQGWLVGQLAELASRRPEVLLVLAGPCTHPEYGEAVRAQVAREGLAGHVLLTGPLPPGDARLVGLFQEARAVLLPSISETFGLVILEAWAAGTAVISSRTSGATALVRDGANGWLFDLAEPAGFHRAVDLLATQPEQGTRAGAAGRTTVLAGYDTAVLAGRMKRLYEELMEEKHALRYPA